jgi:hypothetical protein
MHPLGKGGGVKIHVTANLEGLTPWSVLASSRNQLADGGWCLVIEGNAIRGAIGDPLDGQVWWATLNEQEGECDIEWRVDGLVHEVWCCGEMLTRAVASAEMPEGLDVHVGQDPWFPRRAFAGAIQVEVTSE